MLPTSSLLLTRASVSLARGSLRALPRWDKYDTWCLLRPPYLHSLVQCNPAKPPCFFVCEVRDLFLLLQDGFKFTECCTQGHLKKKISTHRGIFLGFNLGRMQLKVLLPIPHASYLGMHGLYLDGHWGGILLQSCQQENISNCSWLDAHHSHHTDSCPWNEDSNGVHSREQYFEKTKQNKNREPFICRSTIPAQLNDRFRERDVA